MKTQDLKPFLPAQDLRKALGLDDEAAFNLERYMLRPEYNRRYGFPLVSQEVLATLTTMVTGKKVLDAGSGTGFLSDAIAQHSPSATVVAAEWDGVKGYGFEGIIRRDYHGSALDLLPGEFDIVILSWPNYDHPFGVDILDAMKAGQTLIYQGESQGGCTANDDFFRQLQMDHWNYLDTPSNNLNTNHVQFQGIHDYWHVYQKMV
jgi:hypothetical protein